MRHSLRTCRRGRRATASSRVISRPAPASREQQNPSPLSILPLHDTHTALLDPLRAGDADALTQLFARHGERAYATAYRLTCSADEARDVVQDVWVALPEAARSYVGRGSFEG